MFPLWYPAFFEVNIEEIDDIRYPINPICVTRSAERIHLFLKLFRIPFGYVLRTEFFFRNVNKGACGVYELYPAVVNLSSSRISFACKCLRIWDLQGVHNRCGGRLQCKWWSPICHQAADHAFIKKHLYTVSSVIHCADSKAVVAPSQNARCHWRSAISLARSVSSAEDASFRQALPSACFTTP